MAADRLKQRLTGAVALLLLATVAWFWLLDSDRPVEPVARTSEIPPAPAIEPFSVPEPRRPADVEPIGTVAATPPPAAPAPRPELKTETKAAPKIAPKPISKPEPAPAPKPAPKPAVVAAPVPAPKETYQRDAQDLPVAWVVQVASLSSASAAEQLKKSLQDKGFKAYTQTVKSGSGQAVRVYVGPKLSREQADTQKRQIDSAFKVNAMVVRFQP